MKIIKKIKAIIKYNVAVREAQQLREKTGLKQYVLTGDDGRLLVMTKQHFYNLRKINVIDKSLKPRNLNAIAVWYTDGNNSQRMSEKTAQRRKQKYIQLCKCI